MIRGLWAWQNFTEEETKSWQQSIVFTHRGLWMSCRKRAACVTMWLNGYQPQPVCSKPKSFPAQRLSAWSMQWLNIALPQQLGWLLTEEPQKWDQFAVYECKSITLVHWSSERPTATLISHWLKPSSLLLDEPLSCLCFMWKPVKLCVTINLQLPCIVHLKQLCYHKACLS